MKNKRTKKEEALERQKEHNSLTIKQKILKLDIRYGEGKEANAERTRLTELLLKEQSNVNKVNITDKTEEVKKKTPYQKPKKS